MELAKLNDRDLFRLSAKVTRRWRAMEMKLLSEMGCADLSFRPCTGMSSLGWVLAHQAAVYDFSLNMLIRQSKPKNPKLFALYAPGTSGDWAGTSAQEIQDYYDDAEEDFLHWIDSTTEEDLERKIEEGTAPSFFVGMTVREVVANAFAHLNYHTGHLAPIRKDWQKTRVQS